LRIEAALGKKIPELEVREEDVLIFSERVGEAQREAAKDLREVREKKGGRREGRSGGKEGKGGKRSRDDMDREEE
jgi:ATP-dependent RNA helicase DDX47/RRP3